MCQVGPVFDRDKDLQEGQVQGKRGQERGKGIRIQATYGYNTEQGTHGRGAPFFFSLSKRLKEKEGKGMLACLFWVFFFAIVKMRYMCT